MEIAPSTVDSLDQLPYVLAVLIRDVQPGNHSGSQSLAGSSVSCCSESLDSCS